MDLTKKGGKVRIRNMGDDDHGIKCSGHCLSITRRGMVMRSQEGRCTNNFREVKEAAGTGKYSRVASLKPGLCQIKITGLTRHSLYPQRIWATLFSGSRGCRYMVLYSPFAMFLLHTRP